MTQAFDIKLDAAGRHVEFKMACKDEQVDRDIAWCLNHFGCCEPETAHLILRAVRPGDTVVDGGANVGFFTLLLSRLVGETGQVFAFEPSFKNGIRLGENAVLNDGVSNVIVYSYPLWSSKTKVNFNFATDGGLNSIGEVEHLVDSVEMETTTLNDTVDITPRLIKLDIEGSEEQALLGAKRHLKNQICPYIIVELNLEAMKKLNSSQNSLRTFMQEMGYTTFLLHRSGAYPSQLPTGTVIQPTLPNSAVMSTPCNILFSTPEAVAEIFPTTVSA